MVTSKKKPRSVRSDEAACFYPFFLRRRRRSRGAMRQGRVPGRRVPLFGHKIEPRPAKAQAGELQRGPFAQDAFRSVTGRRHLPISGAHKESHKRASRMGAASRNAMCFTKDSNCCPTDQCDLHTTTNFLVTRWRTGCSQPFSRLNSMPAENLSKQLGALLH